MALTTPNNPIEILLVEDSAADVMMAQEALSYNRVLNKLHLVEDGVEALSFLRRQGKYAQAPRPGLILLDLNLPKKSGLEVLAEIKADETLKLIPVVVLTTSQAEEDVVKSYGYHANCYITKPVEFPKLVEAVRTLNAFWFSVVTLPPEPT
jgi:CheY-like chemotaxis protein